MEKLINGLIDARGEGFLSGFLIAADRGYGKMSMISAVEKKGIGLIFIMPGTCLGAIQS